VRGDKLAVLMASRFGRDRWNEHVKLLANLCNAIGGGCLIGAFVAPLVNGLGEISQSAPVLVVVGIGVHFAAQTILSYIVSKD